MKTSNNAEEESSRLGNEASDEARMPLGMNPVKKTAPAPDIDLPPSLQEPQNPINHFLHGCLWLHS